MKKNSTIEAVIFDMDGVFYNLDLNLRLKLIAETTGIDTATINNLIWQSDFESKAEQGFYTSGQSYLEAFNEILGTKISSHVWLNLRSACMTPIEGMLDLCRSLSKHYKVALLTNNGMLVKDGLQQKLIAPDLFDIFKGNLYTSAELGARKPDRDVYLNICKILKVSPHKALMIDDKKENVIGAELAGLAGHHYQNTECLIAYLQSQNITC